MALDVLSVVVDQQPALGGPVAQVLKNLPGDLGHIAVGGQDRPELLSQLPSQIHQRRFDVLGWLAVQPEDDVVIFSEPVRVLQRHLGLTDAAGTLDVGLLQDHGPAPRPQRLAQFAQEFVPAGEVGVAGGTSAQIRRPPVPWIPDPLATTGSLLRRPAAPELLDQAVRRSFLGQVAQGDDGHAVKHSGRHSGVGNIDEVLGIGERLDVPPGRLNRSQLGVLEPGDVEVRQHPDYPDGMSALSGTISQLADQPNGVTGASQHGGDPLGPDLVLRAEVDNDLGPARRRRPGEHPPGAQPQPFLPRRKLGDLVSGDPGRDPLV